VDWRARILYPPVKKGRAKSPGASCTGARNQSSLSLFFALYNDINNLTAFERAGTGTEDVQRKAYNLM
jgi:hypothetical protein